MLDELHKHHMQDQESQISSFIDIINKYASEAPAHSKNQDFIKFLKEFPTKIFQGVVNVKEFIEID